MNGKSYIDQPVKIVKIHVWGLRSGVKIAVEGYIDAGRKISVFHPFNRQERILVDGNARSEGGAMDMVKDLPGYEDQAEDCDQGRESTRCHNDRAGRVSPVNTGDQIEASPSQSVPGKSNSTRALDLVCKLSNKVQRCPRNSDKTLQGKDKIKPNRSAPNNVRLPHTKESQRKPRASTMSGFSLNDTPEPGGREVIFKATKPIVVPNSGVNITVERRNYVSTTVGLSMVTSVVHAWFNAFFEGSRPENDGQVDDSGVFSVTWDKMDRIKGTRQRGTQALERLSVVWRIVPAVAQSQAADGGRRKDEKLYRRSGTLDGGREDG